MIDEQSGPLGALGSLEALLGSAGLAEDLADTLDRKSCCAALYQLEPVRLLLGDSLHPGGLALTHRLGKLVDIKGDDLVLDLACGSGASALAAARSFHCRVMGVDLGSTVVGAERLATDANMRGRASFFQGDAEALPLSDGSFDAVLCECSLSLFPDKAKGIAEIARLLRPGGRVGISDVTVEAGCLPDELKGALGQMLCLAGAPSVDGYRELLGADGITLIHQEDASNSILGLLENIEGKIAAFRMLLSLRSRPSEVPDLIPQALALVEKVRALVKEGSIGYWLFVAEKSQC